MGASFLLKGKKAQTEVAKSEAQAEAKKAESSGPRRFWIPSDKEGQITFLDGDLDDEGLLDVITFWEHNLKLNGHWRNWFACTQLSEPCPICEGGDDAKLVAVFTIIDHSEWKDGKGVTHKNERRLFVAKRETLSRLQKIATKRGGLKGCTFDVSRSGDMSPGCGDVFDFTEKRTMSELREEFELDAESVKPFDYDKVITYRSAKELRQLGFGAGGKGPVGGKEVGGHDDEDDHHGGKPSGGKGKPKAKADTGSEYEEEM